VVQAGKTALHFASIEGRSKVISVLLEAKAQVDCVFKVCCSLTPASFQGLEYMDPLSRRSEYWKTKDVVWHGAFKFL
jgi:hypothetical protein